MTILFVLFIIALPFLMLFGWLHDREVAAKKKTLADAITVLTDPKRDPKAAALAAETLANMMVDEAEATRSAASSSGIGGTVALAYLIEKDKRR